MSEYLLEIDNINLSYGIVPVLKGITIKAKEKGVVSIIGPNGAGKTTLLKGILNYITPIAGSIKLRGKVITKMPTYSIVKSGVGYVPQGGGVFPSMTVYENLEMGAYIHRKDIKKIRLLIERVYDIFPKIKERYWQKAGTLSGGERQMLSISRALMTEPAILLLDEPSLGLSPIVLRSVYAAIKEMKDRGISIFLVEQNMSAAMSIADYVYILELGKIQAEGSKEAIMENHDIRKKYFGFD